jgi:hypothetical protein
MSTHQANVWHLVPPNTPDQHPWPWWRRLALSDQNITADIEFARVELSGLTELPLKPEDKNILNNCLYMLQKCIDNHRRLIRNRMFVRQTLFTIMQQVILIMPRDNLEATWLALKQRLEANAKPEEEFYTKHHAISDIESFLRGEGHDEKTERRVRRLMRRIRFLLDEKILTDLWQAGSLQRLTNFCSMLSLLVILSILVMIALENHCKDVGQILAWSCEVPKDPKTGIVTAFLAGVLGGIISTVWKPNDDKEPQSLPLVRITFLRPVLGGIAALFLYVLSASEIMTIKYPGLYAAALAIGFSERAFIGLLNTSANQIGAGVSRAIGQFAKSDSPDSTHDKSKSAAKNGSGKNQGQRRQR